MSLKHGPSTTLLVTSRIAAFTEEFLKAPMLQVMAAGTYLMHWAQRRSQSTGGRRSAAAKHLRMDALQVAACFEAASLEPAQAYTICSCLDSSWAAPVSGFLIELH